MDDITKRRWATISDPAAFAPETALAVATDQAPEWQPDHVFVIFAKREDEGPVVSKILQAGKYDSFAQMGALWHVLSTY